MKPYTFGTQLKDVGEGKQPAVRNQILTCVLALYLKTVGHITSLSRLLLLFYQPYNQQSYIFVRRLSTVGQGCLCCHENVSQGPKYESLPRGPFCHFCEDREKCQVVNIIVNVMSVGKHVYYFMLIRGNFFC